ncbi:MAG TPA: SDR family oxidoreductase [bacterium]|nr:SDR family oxidoreductase [bacterium]
MEKYLITGGAGFIGSNIVKQLLKLKKSVRIVDNFSTGREENIKEFIGNPNLELINGDLTDLNICRKSVKKIDFVLHQAAIPSVPRSIKDPLKSNNANIVGTLNLLIAARDEKVKRFVYASSSSVYGDSPKLPKEEKFPINPISPYALTKYTGEKYTQLFWQIYKLPTISLRYFNVFGPRQNPKSQYAAVIPNFITKLLKKDSPVIYGDGNQSRDFTYVDNVVNANLLAIKTKQDFGEVFNISYGKQINLNQLFKLLQEIIKVNIKPKYQEPRDGDILHSRADISKARNALNYIPKIELKEGLIKTVEWFKNYEKF